MTRTYRPGDLVHTPFGKGAVREWRNSGRVSVDVRGRAMVFAASELAPAVDSKRRRSRGGRGLDGSTDDRLARGHAASEIDLHDLTIEQALGRVESALNDALLANLPELRLIHGRSGGRIRHAVHRWLASVTAVRAFRLDPQNEGVTVVKL